MLKEGLECNAHVVIFELLAEFIAEFVDALFLEGGVDVALFDRCKTQSLVSIHIFTVLPEVLRLLDDVASHKHHSFIVLNHQGAVVEVWVLCFQQDDFRA